MLRPYELAVRRPAATVTLGALVALCAASGIPRLRMETDGRALSPGGPAARFDREVSETFGLGDPLVVVIRGKRSVFEPRALAVTAELSAALVALPGVGAGDVLSLATEKSDRVVPGTLRFRTYLDSVPASSAEIQRLSDDLRAVELYSGTLVATDESATAIFVNVPSSTRRSWLLERVRALSEQHARDGVEIDVVGAPAAEVLLGFHLLDDLGVPARLTGAAPPEREAARVPPGSPDDLRLLVATTTGLLPLALALMALVFFAVFRSGAAIMLPLTEVAACLLFVFGLMGWAGVPVYLTIPVMAVVLTAVGVADEIHVFHRYRSHLGQAALADHRAIIRRTMQEMTRPIVRTSITTAVGFLSFAVSPVAPVRAFGVCTALGVLFCLLWSLTVVPACLALIDPSRLAPWGVTSSPASGGRRLERFARAIVRRPVPLLVAGALLVAAATPALLRLRVQDSWIAGFAEGSRFRRASDAFNRDFLGMHQLRLVVETGEPVVARGRIDAGAVGRQRVSLPRGIVPDPESLAGRWIELSVPPSDAPGEARRSISAPITEVTTSGGTIVLDTEALGGTLRLFARRAGADSLGFVVRRNALLAPETYARLAALSTFLSERSALGVGGVIGPLEYLEWTSFLLGGRREEARAIPETPRAIRSVWDHYVRVRGQARLDEVVDRSFSRGVVTVYMRDANYENVARLVEETRDHERAQLAPAGIRLGLAGDVAVSQALIRAITTTQLRSLLLSLVMIVVITAIMSRSLLAGFYAVLPCAVAVVSSFAVMGALDVPLGVATSMFAGMTLGIGVDYAIHLLERHRLAASRGSAPREAVVDAVVATGPAVSIDALAVALGFGVLVLSQVPANARLGGLVVSSVVGCWAASMILLPALLAVQAPRIRSASPTAAS